LTASNFSTAKGVTLPCCQDPVELSSDVRITQMNRSHEVGSCLYLNTLTRPARFPFGRSSPWHNLCIFPAVKRQSCAAGPPARLKIVEKGLAKLLIRGSHGRCLCTSLLLPLHHYYTLAFVGNLRPIFVLHQALTLEPISARILNKPSRTLRSTTNCTTRSPRRVPGHLFRPITPRSLACGTLRHVFSIVV